MPCSLAGMSSVRAAKYEVALKHLAELEREPAADPAMAARGKLYQGIALNYLGRYGDAIVALRGAGEAVNRDDPEEYGQWLSAVAVAYQKTGRPELAIRYFDAWYAVATPAEKAFAAAQIRAIAEGLPENALEPAYRELETRDGPGAAYLGSRLAAAYTARGDLDRAGQIREQIAAARAAMGEVPDFDQSGEGDRKRLGAILPLAWYPENANSFATPIAELKKPWRAIFIRDQARRLSLVAPALAAANFLARPADEAPARSGPRKIVVLSTAELADDGFVRSTGRYTLGGVLAPGFYAGSQGRRHRPIRRELPVKLWRGADRARSLRL